MEFLSKGAFFVMFGLSCLVALYLLTMITTVALDAYGKKSEAVIMLVGITLLIAGLYIAFGYVKNGERFFLGCIAIALTWLITLIVILVGLLFFNGPIKWN